jgi:hypothetical protein
MNRNTGKLTSKFATTISIGFIPRVTSHSNIFLCYTVLHEQQQPQKQQQQYCNMFHLLFIDQVHYI